MALNSKFNQQRRQFLKVGLMGSAVLTIAACGSTLSREPESAKKYLWLQPKEDYLLSAIIPVMLEGALPENKIEFNDAVAEIIKGIDISVAHMPANVREEVRQLFSLLGFSVTRIMLAGIWPAWHEADAEDIADFLTNWKTSGFDLLRIGYTALHDLMAGSWYANPRSWKRISYPGPPAI